MDTYGAHVVDETGKADFPAGAGEADGADHQTHRSLLPGEVLLYPGAHLGLRRIGAGGLFWRRLALGFAPMNSAGEAGLGEMRLILRRARGGVRPDRAGGVRPVEQGRRLGPIVTGGVGGRPGPDQSVPAVDPHMVRRRPEWRWRAAAPCRVRSSPCPASSGRHGPSGRASPACGPSPRGCALRAAPISRPRCCAASEPRPRLAIVARASSGSAPHGSSRSSSRPEPSRPASPRGSVLADSRSLTRHSVRSSDREWLACRIRRRNIDT